MPKAIFQGLLEALIKMIENQLQVFREKLKIGHCKQKLPSKQTISEALQELMEPDNWCVTFSKKNYWFFFLLYL